MRFFMNSAILFEPDGYVLSGEKLMGRHAAGHAFLRAAVSGRDGLPLSAYTPHRGSFDVFTRLVHAFDPSAETRWIPANRLDLLERTGTLYIPGPGLDTQAWLRLRRGVTAYSVCGVTHTTASHGAMDSIAGLLEAPVMEWDALICTSEAVRESVRLVLDAGRDYLQWRFGSVRHLTIPKLPVIPLGVHCDDFRFDEAERKAAREALGISDGAVVALFAGRLSFHAKAHPFAMYAALQQVAERSGRELVLVQSGWFANDHIGSAFTSGSELFCPGVRVLCTDGRKPEERRRSWAAADLFISLSDNIQETFGLTPIEAMAAGLPSLVTDWDGYRDTVRDGIDGFRIATRMPEKGCGSFLAEAHESGSMGYDMYCGYACQLVSLDISALVLRLSELCGNPELRFSMGNAARKRAEEVFDWRVIFSRYKELWQELDAVRAAAAGRSGAVPSCSPARLDPFTVFQHYSTFSVNRLSAVSLQPGSGMQDYRQRLAHPLFSYAAGLLPKPGEMERFFLFLMARDTCIIGDISREIGLDESSIIRAVVMLEKMDIVTIS